MTLTWQDLIDKASELGPDFLVQPARVRDDGSGELLEIRDMIFPDEDEGIGVPFLITE